MDIAPKRSWQDRVKAVHFYHLEQLRKDISWSVRDTAKELNMSIGTISENIQLAEFLRSYESELSILRNYVDALAWMKEKKLQLAKRRI